jgi:hypothetical protein
MLGAQRGICKTISVTLEKKIKDTDAQMFVAQLERKKEVNPAFFYEFMLDEQG